jgi:methionyl aminopeptidase
MTENQKLDNGSQKEKSKEEIEKEEELKLKNESLKKAGKIAQEVKKILKPKIKVGAKALDIVTFTEAKIEELGGFCAFPVNFCINHIAAHYTSPFKDDGLVINDGDMVKIDLGVHVEGYIVDTAFTVNFNEEESREIGKKIEDIVKGFKFNPIKELGGHQIERWKVHGSKQVPELGSQGGDIMEEGEVFSIEIFASNGEGSIHSTPSSHIYELNPYAGRVPLRRKSSKQVLGFINKNYKSLPFAERWLAKEFRMGVAFGLQELVQQGKLQAHFVLAEKKGVFVAQSEETLLITEDGYDQLT